MDNIVLLLFIVLVIFFAFLLFKKCSLKCSSRSEGFNRYGKPPYVDMCEFQPDCLFDAARTIQLSNGMAGNCTLHGLACPSFSKDHNRAKNMGLSNTMVSDNYMAELLMRKYHDNHEIENLKLYGKGMGPDSDFDELDMPNSLAMGNYPME